MKELIIFLVVIILMVLCFFFWCACKLAKESDEKNDEAFAKYLREKKEHENDTYNN